MWSLSLVVGIICVSSVFCYQNPTNINGIGFQRKHKNEALRSHNSNNEPSSNLRKKICTLFIGSSFLMGNVLPTLPAKAIDAASLQKYTVTPGAGIDPEQLKKYLSVQDALDAADIGSLSS